MVYPVNPTHPVSSNSTQEASFSLPGFQIWNSPQHREPALLFFVLGGLLAEVRSQAPHSGGNSSTAERNIITGANRKGD